MAVVAQQAGSFHPLPVIGHPEAYYVKQAKAAEEAHNPHARAAHKVGQYITLGLDRTKPWHDKLGCFTHALKHYCVAPPDSSEALRTFYGKLADLVRRHAGHEALRIAHEKHDEYSIRLSAGATRDEIAEDAEVFFPQLLGHLPKAPEWFTEDVWRQLHELERRWV